MNVVEFDSTPIHKRIKAMSHVFFPKVAQRVAAPLIPTGFRFGATKAGIRPSGKPDFACVEAPNGATAAAVFTSNRLVAAPIQVGLQHLRQSGGRVRFVAINAGNANCATGDEGIRACREICAAAATQFGCADQEIFPSSTGIIGVPLPAEKLIAALPKIAMELSNTSAHLQQFAEAIMTTDTRVKIAGSSLDVDGKRVHILGVAKGAGMIAPQVVPHATMLVYLFTDIEISAGRLQTLLNEAVEPTFNSISVDGDTSTNDTVLLLGSGASGVAWDRCGENAQFSFAEELRSVCSSLARQIVEDGEGAGHVIELQIEGAANEADARRVARSIANSPLVKTAFAGCDPNWGRIMTAAGYSGVALDPAKASLWIGGLPVFRYGQVAPDFEKSSVHRAMTERDVTVRLDLGMGESGCAFLTCDLTAEYIRVNAGYSYST
jgi:glutamate N-acetyltransferase / amino-acid N-acetyltransferase